MYSGQVAIQNQGNAKGLVSPITSPGVAYEVVCEGYMVVVTCLVLLIEPAVIAEPVIPCRIVVL